MLRDRHNVIPFTLALCVHAVLVAALVITVDFSRTQPITPLAVRATLVTDSAVVLPPPVVEQPEPEPVVQQPEPEPVVIEPDPTEQQRIAAEEEKRRQDALIEQERLEKIRQQEELERIRKAEEQKRLEREAEERRKREAEAELERKRAEAEAERQRKIDEQRRRNEEMRRQAEQQLAAELDAETQRMDAIAAGARDAYIYAIQQKVQRNWVKPASAKPGLECDVRVSQLPGGAVVSVNIVRCNGDAAVQRSIIAAVEKASPLPEPADPSVFERNLMLVFKPEQ